MKIKIDRDYTMGIEANKVKEDCVEFRYRYTDNDLVSLSQIEIGYGYKLVYANVEAFPAGWFYGNKTHFKVKILLEIPDGFKKLFMVVILKERSTRKRATRLW